MTFIWRISESKKCAYFQNEVDVSGEGLHSVETGDESNGQEALLIHLPPQEEVALQVVQAEVVLATGGGEVRKDVFNIFQYILASQLLLFVVVSSFPSLGSNMGGTRTRGKGPGERNKDTIRTK